VPRLKIRDQIHAATPAPANFNLAQDGTRTVFPMGQVRGITWNQQTRDDRTPDANSADYTPLLVIPGAVGHLAFGKYLSPDYEVHPGEFIPPVETRTGSPVVQGVNDIYFNLALPSGPMPANGWPVVIFGHGILLAKDSSLSWSDVGAVIAAHGFATIARSATAMARLVP
jgi:hypothetical protein